MYINRKYIFQFYSLRSKLGLCKPQKFGVIEKKLKQIWAKSSYGIPPLSQHKSSKTNTKRKHTIRSFVRFLFPIPSISFTTMSSVSFTPMASTGIQIPSLCLPRVYFRFDERYIENVFLNIFGGVENGDEGFKSCVSKIDLLERKDRKTNEPFWVVFLHFHDGVANTPETRAFVKKIEAGEEVKLIYSGPWFWKVRKNTSTRNAPKKETKPRFIMNDEDEQEVLKNQKKWRESKKGQNDVMTSPPPAYPGPPPTQEDVEAIVPQEQEQEQQQQQQQEQEQDTEEAAAVP